MDYMNERLCVRGPICRSVGTKSRKLRRGYSRQALRKVHAVLLSIDIDDVCVHGTSTVHVGTVHACCDTSNTKPSTANCQPRTGRWQVVILRGGGCTHAAKTARSNEASAARQPTCMFSRASAHPRSRYHGCTAICSGSE